MGDASAAVKFQVFALLSHPLWLMASLGWISTVDCSSCNFQGLGFLD